MSRFGGVLDQLVRLLPDKQEEVAAVLTQTEAVRTSYWYARRRLQSSSSLTGMSRALVTLAHKPCPPSRLRWVEPSRPLLSTKKVRQRLRETVLAGSLPPSGVGSDIKVLVQNGVGSPDISEEAAALLRAEGYEYVNGGNADQFDKERSVILIPDTTTASIELGNSVAETLGLPESAIKTTDQGATVADVIVILGVDFNP